MPEPLSCICLRKGREDSKAKPARISDEHHFHARVLRVRRAPGRSFSAFSPPSILLRQTKTPDLCFFHDPYFFDPLHNISIRSNSKISVSMRMPPSMAHKGE